MCSSDLYPRDRMRLDVSAEELEGFTKGARSLILRAFDRSRQGSDAPTSWLRVKLVANGVTRFERVISVDDLVEGGASTFPIDPPIGPQATGVTLDVSNESGNFVLLSSARLSDKAP